MAPIHSATVPLASLLGQSSSALNAPPSQPARSISALHVALAYAVVGFAWITLSDLIVDAWFPPAAVRMIQTFKGWGFVAVTAAVVYLMSARALTAQAATDSALIESEKRLRAYLQHAPVAVFVLDPTGRCLDANPRGAELVGTDLEHLLTLSIQDIVPRDEAGARRAADAVRRLTLDGWVDGEFRLRQVGGRIIWISVRAVRLGDGRLLAFAYDITARKTAEERQRQAATVYANSAEGMILTDRNGTILAANPAFTAITGYAEHEVIGQNPRLLKSGVQDRDWYRTFWRSLEDAGRWQGEVWNRRRSGELFPEWLTVSAVKNEAGEVTNYVGLFTDISRLKQSEAQLDYLAHTDPLTGLSNRLQSTSRLNHAVARARLLGSRVGVLFIDLDRFRLVNDGAGFEAGDETLQVVAGRLRDVLGPATTIGRLGADEFIVVLEDVGAPDQAALTAERLLARLGEEIRLSSGDQIKLDSSIGISLFPDDGSAASQLLPQASTAAAHVKQIGGAGFRFHTTAMAEAAQRRFALETELRRAVDQKTLTVHYQPRVEVATGRLDGVEALVRWPRDTGELTLPGDFIGLAESTGLILPLGEWVLEEACRQMRQWLDAGAQLRTVAVNVSPRQIAAPGFTDTVEGVLQRTGLAPSALELEITETTLLESGPETHAVLGRLRALGVRLALDDFGTGYSSFAILHQLPIDTIKIDRSFLSRLPADRTTHAVVSAMVTMAGQLGLLAVAEGVETEAQRQFLVECGCPLVQGHLLGRPEPPALVEARWRQTASRS